MNLFNLETYGKLNLPKRTILEVRNRFRVNPITEKVLQANGIGTYVPKLNKVRFSVSIVLAIIFIILPVVTILSVPTILWGLK